MSNIMKPIIIFFLLLHFEVYSLQLKSENHHYSFLSHRRSLKFHHKMRQQAIIEAIRKKFSSNGKNPDESKLCNFIIGAVTESYKILLQKTGIAQIQKCFYKAVSIYKNANQSPTKSLGDLDQTEEVNDSAAQTTLDDIEKSENSKQEDPATSSGIAESEQTAEEVNTQMKEDVKKEEGGAEFLANEEKEENLDSAAARFSQIKLPNFLKGNPVTSALSGATEKLKNSVKKITSKLSNIVGKFKDKFNKIEEAVRK